MEDRMDARASITQLAELTGSLEPTGGASADDLRAARLALAYALLHGQTEATHAPLPLERTPQPRYDPLLQAELSGIVSEAAREADTRSSEPLELRVFRRELPVLTDQHPELVPAWAAGLQIDSTLGPFRGLGGRLFWFDLYRSVLQVAIVRLPGGLYCCPCQSAAPCGPPRVTVSLPAASGSLETPWRFQRQWAHIQGSVSEAAGWPSVRQLPLVPAGYNFRATSPSRSPWNWTRLPLRRERALDRAPMLQSPPPILLPKRTARLDPARGRSFRLRRVDEALRRSSASSPHDGEPRL